MATKKRRLADLYVTGRDVVFDDGKGEPLTVWVQKLNPVDTEKAMRRANAARSRVLASTKDHESEDYASARLQVEDFGDREVLVDYMISERRNQILIAREAELAAEDEWSKDDYLQGLRDAWEGGLDEKFAMDTEDPDAKRVFLELQRFTDIVAEQMQGEIAALQRDYEDVDLETLREKVTERVLQTQADLTWMTEFRKSEIWLAVREPDNHKTKYFTEREEVDELPPEVLGRLVNALSEISVEVDEGKG